MADMSETERKLELLPCPFCGSIDVFGVVEDDIAFTKCNGCFATGPSIFHRRVGAEEDDWTDPWNHRPTTGVQQAIEVVEKLLDVALVAEDWSGHSYLEMALEELRALPHQPTSDGLVEALRDRIVTLALRVADDTTLDEDDYPHTGYDGKCSLLGLVRACRDLTAHQEKG